MKSDAILNLYPNIKSVEKDTDNNFKCFDVDGNEVEISDWNAVETKATELQTQAEADKQSLIDLKASAKAKLIAGEALTEDEANTIVL